MTSSSRASSGTGTCCLMWCLERLLLGPERLLRGRNRLYQDGARRATALTPAGCPNVLTPDRIPEFCIPPRLVSCPTLTAIRDSWGEQAGTDDGAGRTDWDPRSQAALSLQHLPRARTAYGFCALLESPHTRRRESLFLGGPGAAALPPAPRPRAHTYGGGGGNDPFTPRARAPIAPREARSGSLLDALGPGPRCHRFLRASEELLRRVLRTQRNRDLARACSVSSGDEDDEDENEGPSGSGSPARAPGASPSPTPNPLPERLEAEGTVTLGGAGGALRLAAEYSRASGRLRVRLLRAEGPAGGAAEPRAPVGCRVSFILKPRGAVVRRSRRAVLEQDLCLDGLSEDEVRRLAVRVKAENRGRGLERGRLLGQGELLLGPLLLL
ncbi:C2 calcium-dependent domain-containing protein 4A [Ovis aries]|nr:C2 calcium-dependent domain-containing protein 4A [Ovis aries]